jgi:hypothetical protein
MKISELEQFLASIKAESGDIDIVYQYKTSDRIWLDKIRTNHWRVLTKHTETKLLIQL